jgi:hypothetical protein
MPGSCGRGSRTSRSTIRARAHYVDADAQASTSGLLSARRPFVVTGGGRPRRPARVGGTTRSTSRTDGIAGLAADFPTTWATSGVPLSIDRHLITLMGSTFSAADHHVVKVQMVRLRPQPVYGAGWRSRWHDWNGGEPAGRHEQGVDHLSYHGRAGRGLFVIDVKTRQSGRRRSRDDTGPLPDRGTTSAGCADHRLDAAVRSVWTASGPSA